MSVDLKLQGSKAKTEEGKTEDEINEQKYSRVVKVIPTTRTKPHSYHGLDHIHDPFLCSVIRRNQTHIPIPNAVQEARLRPVFFVSLLLRYDWYHTDSNDGCYRLRCMASALKFDDDKNVETLDVQKKKLLEDDTRCHIARENARTAGTHIKCIIVHNV